MGLMKKKMLLQQALERGHFYAVATISQYFVHNSPENVGTVENINAGKLMKSSIHTANSDFPIKHLYT